jgi:ABC-type bacteriocin/lantibiotic exporter with double-glycine peptidase domain
MFTNALYSKIKNTFILQEESSDGGVACLASIANYYGGDVALEKIRDLSGTSADGTTMLGLYQAAQHAGFSAEGLQADDIRSLIDLQAPVIIHVILEGALHNFFVYYGYNTDQENFIIGDPKHGIVNYSLPELESVWQTKSLLRLTPNENFVKKVIKKASKKRFLLSLIQDDLNTLFLTTFLSLIISFIGFSIAFFSQELIDNTFPTGTEEKILKGIGLIALLLLAYNLTVYLKNLFGSQQGMDFNNRIVEKFYKRMLRFPKTVFDSKKDDEFIARKNDIRLVQNAIATIYGEVIANALHIVIFFAIALSYSPLTALIAISSIPFYALTIYLFTDGIMRSQKKLIGGRALAEHHYIESIHSIPTIKVLNKEDFFESAHRQIYGFFQRKLFNTNKLNIRFTFISEIITTLQIALIIGMVIRMIIHDTLSYGEITAVLILTGSIIFSIHKLAKANGTIQEGYLAFNRLYEFMTIKPESYSSGPFPTGAEDRFTFIEDFRLKFKNLSFRFPGRKQLLRDVSFRVKRGEIISLFGESGCGKSTLIQILQKFYKPEFGKIEINSIDLNKIQIKQWRKMIGVVPQDIKIFNHNLLYNLTLSEQPDEVNNVIEFCRHYGFDKYFDTFQQGYLTVLGEDGVNISGGQRQLVALARAMYRNPQLLLLDEATSAMDGKMERFVLDLLQRIKSKMAIIVVTHRVAISQKTDRVYLLENGEIALFGSPNELIMTDNPFSEFVKGPKVVTS